MTMTNINVALYTGHTVSKALLGGVQKQIEDVMPAMEPKVGYTAKELCGMAYWLKLNKRECRKAGRCLAHLVVMKELPLKFFGPRRKYPKKYSLI